VEIISLSCKSVLRAVFLANHLASTDNLASNNQETEHIQTQTNINTKVAIINNEIYTEKMPMLTEKTEPGLVAFYNIWPGNGVGLFLQPRSLHRADTTAVYYFWLF